jgi:hypothetical protein
MSRRNQRPPKDEGFLRSMTPDRGTQWGKHTAGARLLTLCRSGAACLEHV